MSLKLLLNNTIWLTISHLLSRGSLMVVGILLAKYLSTQDFAMYSYFQMTIVLIASYASMGLGPTASKYFAELSIDRDNVEIEGLVNSLVSISTLVAIFISIVILMVPDQLLSPGLNISNFLFSIAVFIMIVGIVPLGAIQGLEKYKELAVVSVINAIALFFGAYLAVKYNDAYIAIYSFIFASFIQLIAQMYISYKGVITLNTRNFYLINKKIIRKLSGFVGPLILVTILNSSATYYMGRSVLKIYGDLYFSVFSIGLQWFSLALFIPGLISRVVLPRLIRQKSGNKKMLVYSSITAFAFSVSFFLSGFLAKEMLIGFYGDKYSSFSYVIGYFLAISIFYAPINTLSNAVLAKLGSKYWFYITLIWFLVLMAVFNTFLDKEPIMSIIYAHGISSIIMLCLTITLCIKKKVL